MALVLADVDQARRDTIRDLLTQIVQSPNEPHLLKRLAETYRLIDSTNESLRLYMLVLQTVPEDSEALVGMVRSFEDQEQYDSAIVFAKRLLERHPSSVQPYVLLANLHSENDELLDAIVVLKNAIDKFPDSASLYVDAGAYSISLKLNDEAYRFLHRALELDSSEWLGHENLGNLDVNQQRYSDAIREYTIAIRGDPYAYYCRGRLYYKLGKLDSAWSDCRHLDSSGYEEEARTLRDMLSN